MVIKKYDLPAMPFYIGDWKKDPAIQVLSREDKMIWLELIMLMWESEERGYLTINRKPMNNEMIASALNLDNQILSKRLTSYEELGLFSRRDSDNAIYSRKIVKIVELSNKRKNAGKQGGNPNLVNQKSTKSLEAGYPNTETETINEVSSLVVNKRKEQILEYCKEQDYPISEGESFYDHYQALGWKTSAGMGIVDWKAKMRTWHKEQINREQKSGFKNTKPGKGSIDADKYKRLLSKEPVL
jgi:hypothetical protein